MNSHNIFCSFFCYTRAGDKIASTIIGQSANVSCVPWSGSGITVDYAKEGVPEDAFDRACVKSLEEAYAAIAKIGFPCMIKASEGGGKEEREREGSEEGGTREGRGGEGERVRKEGEGSKRKVISYFRYHRWQGYS